MLAECLKHGQQWLEGDGLDPTQLVHLQRLDSPANGSRPPARRQHPARLVVEHVEQIGRCEFQEIGPQLCSTVAGCACVELPGELQGAPHPRLAHERARLRRRLRVSSFKKNPLRRPLRMGSRDRHDGTLALRQAFQVLG